MNRTAKAEPLRPWYREPWPWVLIAIPALTVIASAITLWLAISNPDPLAVESTEYQQIRRGMRAQAPVEQSAEQPAEQASDPNDESDNAASGG